MSALRPAALFGLPSAEAVANWGPGTRVRAGRGGIAFAGIEAATHASRALIVTDRRLSACAAVAEVRLRCAVAGVSCAVYDEVVSDPDFGAIAEAEEAIRSARARVVIAIGGGSVLDVAKVAAWSVHNPQLLAGVRWHGGLGTRAPADGAAAQLRPALRTVMLPTTVGTGAEVSAVACISSRPGAEKQLLIDPSLHPTVALIDPLLTRTLPRRQCLQGAFETLTRLLVPFLTDDVERPLQDEISLGIMRAVVRHGHQCARDDDDQSRLGLSLAAVASHVAWANTGRPRGGHVLWYLANPVSPAAAVDKVSALAAVTPAYLRAVARGTHRRLGSPARLARAGAEVLGARATPDQALAGFVGLLEAWDLPAGVADLGAAPLDATELTASALELWGDPDLLGGVPADLVQDIYTAALCSRAAGATQYKEAV
jgi:alcohol dehydrogenase class IV